MKLVPRIMCECIDYVKKYKGFMILAKENQTFWQTLIIAEHLFYYI